MTSRLAQALDRVTRVRGVRAAVLASHADGLVVAAALRDDADGDVLAALGASLVQRLRRAAELAGAGDTRVLHLRAEHGIVCATPVNGDLLLVALADVSANVGLLRLAVLDAAAEVR